jgi:hypothetical protein
MNEFYNDLVDAVTIANPRLFKEKLSIIQSSKKLSRKQWSYLVRCLKDQCAFELNDPSAFCKRSYICFCILLKKIVSISDPKIGLPLLDQGFRDCFEFLKARKPPKECEKFNLLSFYKSDDAGFTLRYFFQICPCKDIHNDPILVHPDPFTIDEKEIQQQIRGKERERPNPRKELFHIQKRVIWLKITMLKEGVKSLSELFKRANFDATLVEGINGMTNAGWWNVYTVLSVIFKKTPFFSVSSALDRYRLFIHTIQKIKGLSINCADEFLVECLENVTDGNLANVMIEGCSLLPTLLDRFSEKENKVVRVFLEYCNPFLKDKDGKTLREVTNFYFDEISRKAEAEPWFNNSIHENKKEIILRLIHKAENKHRALTLLGVYKINRSVFFGMPKDVVKVIAGMVVGKDLTPPRSNGLCK